MIQKQKRYTAGLYCRLSQDDGETVSDSIVSQKELLKQYCHKEHIEIGGYYIDDGFTGTSFDRPDFQRLISDLEDKKINLVIVKDLSRFGRDDATAGMYIDHKFQEMNVRFIAINDGVDTLNDNDWMNMKFKNIFNAYYVQDISKKSRSAKNARARAGLFIGTRAPYGYIRDPDNKNKLLIDHGCADAVRLIFDSLVEGHGYESIKRMLLEKQIPNPMTYFNQQNPDYYKKDYWRKEFDWHANSIRVIVENPVYYGALAYGKSRVIKIGSKKSRRIPREEWILVENCHEPIVSKETWEIAQQMKKKRPKQTMSGRINIFKSVLKCSNCGEGLSINSTKDGRFKSYGCWVHKNHRGRCSPHNIGYKTLYNIVLEDIKKNALIAKLSQDKMIEILSKEDNKRKHDKIEHLSTEITKKEKRLKEIDLILSKMYEDHALGKLSEERYFNMEETLTYERNEIIETIVIKNNELDDLKNSLNDVRDYVEMIQKYANIKELDARVITHLIEKIVVHEKVKNLDGKISQQVEIHYRFVRNIDNSLLIDKIINEKNLI